MWVPLPLASRSTQRLWLSADLQGSSVSRAACMCGGLCMQLPMLPCPSLQLAAGDEEGSGTGGRACWRLALCPV